MKPRCRTAGNLLQIRYSLPYDVQASTVYPITSSNGSSIILCGHRAGLFIAWRGGRPLKETTASTASERPATTQKASSSDVMVIDLDESDDESGKQQQQQRPTSKSTTEPIGPPEPAEFEDEDPEPDPRHPYPPLVQTLDLPVAGGGVTHIAVPLLSEAARATGLVSPELLKSHMLVALACADAAVRLLLLPLSPPSHEAKARRALLDAPRLAEAGMGSWGESVVDVPRHLSHRTLMTGISVGVAPRRLVVDDDDDMPDEGMPDANVDGGLVQRRQQQGSQPDLGAWDILIASVSADAGGTLLVHRIPVAQDGKSLERDYLHTWRNVLLRNPATGVDLHPGSTARLPSYPKVLVAEADGPVRIFECSNEETRDEGGWIGELYGGKVDRSKNSSSSRRVLSARFILGGYAVVALMSDGEWGVWDTSRPSRISQQSFAYNGRLSSSQDAASKGLKASSTSNVAKMNQSSSFAPMTPHTRKVKQNAMFANDPNANTKQASADESVGAAARGGISLTMISREVNSPTDDAHALVWYGASTLFIPNLRSRHLSHLSNKASSVSDPSSAVVVADDPFSSTGGSGTPSQPRLIPAPDPTGLCGGLRVGAAILPSSRGLDNNKAASSVRMRLPEIVVASERAFSIVAHPRSIESGALRVRPRAREEDDGVDGDTKMITAAAADTRPVDLLKGGAELAIDGIEGMLDKMAGGARRLSGRA